VGTALPFRQSEHGRVILIRPDAGRIVDGQPRIVADRCTTSAIDFRIFVRDRESLTGKIDLRKGRDMDHCEQHN